MAAPKGIAATNSGGLSFLFNNLQAAVFGTQAANTNSVGLLPQLLGLEPQAALQISGKNPGGAAELPSTFMYSYTFTRNQILVSAGTSVLAQANIIPQTALQLLGGK